MFIFTINKHSKPLQFLYTLLTAILGGLVFSVFKLPVPWLLGPMASVLFMANLTRVPLYWSTRIRDAGLLIFGYSLGISFTKESLMNMFFQLPIMLVCTVFIILISAITAWWVSRLTGINYPTILSGSIPGGLTQMIVFAEETKGVDVTTVTFFQVIRLLVVIFTIPLLVFSPFFSPGETSGDMGAERFIHAFDWNHLTVWNLILFTVVSFLFALIGRKLKAPTPFLLGPMVGTILLSIVGLKGANLPASIIDLSQLMISVHIGLIMKPDKMNRKGKLLWLSVLSGIILVASSLMVSLGLIRIYDISLTTGFLSLAPGGMDQMGIIAHEVGANLSFVTGFQMIRLLFIYFAIPPILKFVFHFWKKKTKHSSLKDQ